MSIKRGALIVLEGVDRSGKSTQAKKLVESLKKQNIPAELMVFPDRTTSIGKLINQYLSNNDCKLNDKVVHLLFTANRWENVDKMKDLIYQGVTLIVDRYSYSGVAFSSVKKGMDLDWCKHPETGLPKPDLVFLLNVNQDQVKSRPGFGNERYETSEFQTRVSKMYEHFVDETWRKVNAGASVDEVHGALLKEVLKRIEEVEVQPLGRLDLFKRQ